ncbi:pseudouridine synthase [Corynebacterium sp. H113]|uniref:pseudouridine synthase n=1 Tax=Corynebacterium sp. H113 TaxID=3133419 RepID=UPI0030ADC18D
MANAPLPIRDGLNPSRVRVPGHRGDPTVTALELLTAAIYGQRHRHPDDDHVAIAQRFTDGLVVDSNGKPFSPDSVLKPGRDIWFYRVPAIEPVIAGDMPVVYSDDNVVVVDKPPFLATTPKGRHITETAVVRLRRQLDNPELVPAHRLDRMTSGLLIFTARKEARAAYQGLFAAHGSVVKRYEALSEVPTALPETPLQISTRQRKVPGELQAYTIDGEPNAHTIIEKWELIDGPDAPLCRWFLRPLTGRTHQLRLHLWEQGAPILGDQVYPELLPVEAEDPNLPLHLVCTEMSYTDPMTGKPISFRSARSVLAPLQLD